MSQNDDFDKYMKDFTQYIASLLPPKNQWTPVEEAIVKPRDLFNIPNDEMEKLQFKAIKYTFNRHYEHNQIYHEYCREHGVRPEDLTKPADLLKIPLLPDGFYKKYPEGKDFAKWLANIYTGQLPQITISQKNPSYDQVIEAFDRAGVLVTFSSGTSGRHTFIPRDKLTYNRSQYTDAKGLAAMVYPLWDYESSGYILMPNPKKVHIWAGRNLESYTMVVKNMDYAVDRPITTDIIQAAMGLTKGLKSSIIRKASKKSSAKMLDNVYQFLKKHANTDDKISLLGAPWMLWYVMQRLEAEGTTYDYSGGRAIVATGGGWKIRENERVTCDDFRKKIHEVLGIAPEAVIDVYNMVEANGWGIQCPEGHYLHLTNSYFKALILDEENNPIEGYDEVGRLAFLDAAANSYPGFLITGDKVKLLEHCPACGRPGPVLSPEIDRVAGTEGRGCAEEMRTMMARDVGNR